MSYKTILKFFLLTPFMKTMKEELIHYIWLTKKFDLTGLKTVDGQDLEILSFGMLNRDAGPDFLNARIEINGVVWAGHIEIHLNASDWIRHKHGADLQYQNVILHVVLKADYVITLMDGTPIPCLELRDRIDQRVIAQYHYLLNNQSWIPCQDLIPSIDELTKQQTKDSHLVQKLSRSAGKLLQELTALSGNWSTLIYHRIAWSFGLKVNATAMKSLAGSIPLDLVVNFADDLHLMEALFFGQSGLLPPNSEHPYINLLKKSYAEKIKTKKLNPLNKVIWKFSQMRPANFPTIRIAQFCKWLATYKVFIDELFHMNPKDIKTSFRVHLDGFWSDHYRFESSSTPSQKTLGDERRDIILINAIAPLIFTRGLAENDMTLKDRAVSLLESIRSEQNRITKRWVSLGMSNKTSADSQALLHLKKFGCDRHQCISCPIGHKIISQST